MKFLICILALCALLHPILCDGYTALGISKPTGVVLKEIADAVNRLIGSVGYIQFYDVVGSVSMSVVNLDLTLSNIEMKGLTVAQKLDPAQLEFVVDSSVARIRSKSTNFALASQLSLKWSYKSNDMTIYQGTYSANLNAACSKLEFDLTNMTPDSTGNLLFSWSLSNVTAEGFGFNDLVATHVGDLVSSKLYPVFNEELNRYNDIIVASMVYGYFYRNIQLPLQETKDVNVILKNVLAQFKFSNDGALKGRLAMAFSSSIYFPIQHTSTPLTAASTPVDPTDESHIGVFLGAQAMGQLLNQAIAGQMGANFTIDAAAQKQLFKYELDVGLLAAFHPKLAEDYDPKAKVDLFCIPSGFSAVSSTLDATCKFILHENPTVTLITMEKLSWGGVFSLGAAGDEANKQVKVSLENIKMADIKVKSPMMPVYVGRQLLGFLQPLSGYFAGKFQLTFAVVGANLNWSFVTSKSSDKGDLSLFYTRN